MPAWSQTDLAHRPEADEVEPALGLAPELAEDGRRGLSGCRRAARSRSRPGSPGTGPRTSR
ncbi:MAG: hypothetical protein MZV64_43895 [Ignavibacteriales bacterium]|nr:hypothetical protein [Ignavibacteriales bacterium]